MSFCDSRIVADITNISELAWVIVCDTEGISALAADGEQGLNATTCIVRLRMESLWVGNGAVIRSRGKPRKVDKRGGKIQVSNTYKTWSITFMFLPKS